MTSTNTMTVRLAVSRIKLFNEKATANGRQELHNVINILCSLGDIKLIYSCINELIVRKFIKPLTPLHKIQLIRSLHEWDTNKHMKRKEEVKNLRVHGCSEKIYHIQHANEFCQSMFNVIDLSRTENGTPIKMSCAVAVTSLLHIDTANQQFEMRIELDIRLPLHTYPHLFLTGGDPLSPTNWQPALACVNMVECKSWLMRATVLRLGAKDEKRYLRFFYIIDGIFSETLELNWFPFDDQQMSATLLLQRTDARLFPASNMHTLDVTNFTEDNVWKLIHHTPTAVPNGFVWVSSKAETPVCPRQSTSASAIIPIDNRITNVQTQQLTISILLQRKSMYYIWNIYLPMSLLTLMTISNIMIPICAVADRLSVDLTLILTAVAYKFIAAQDLPNVAYLTFLDMHVLVCLVCMFVSVAVTIIIAGLSHTCDVPWSNNVMHMLYLMNDTSHNDDSDLLQYSVIMSCMNIILFILFNIVCIFGGTFFSNYKRTKMIARLNKAVKPEII